MSYKISIIIPVYNGEEDIEYTINSIINQSIGFKNIELIIVDDKSTDNTSNILKYYSKEYENIKPIFLNKNSGGAFVPRNAALKHITAPYLIFMDADDFIVEDYCETLYDAITEENCDIAYCRECMQFIDGIYSYGENSKKRYVVDDPLELRLTVWGNIFKSSFVKKNELKFPPYADDVNFAIRAYTKAKKIVQLPEYYGYIYKVETEGEQSLTHNVSKNNFFNAIKGYNLINDYLEENNIPKQKTFNDKILTMLFMYFKFDENKIEKINMLKVINKFENSLNCKITIKSKPINILNQLILNEHYTIAWIMGEFARIMYNNHTLKKFVFKNFYGLKKIDL